MRAGRFGNGNDGAGHQIKDFLVFICGKPHIAIGQYPYQLASIIYHWHAADPVRFHHFQRITQRFIRRDGQRINHHSSFKPFHSRYLQGLFFNGEVFVNNTDAACLCHGDGQTMFGNGIHCCRNQRQFQLYLAG